ncbi:hypothetical protein BDV41DRAFT_523892 [Aspergillus transmontanensis]|uniref:Uncharacterized protein n=1 Tax=Aspergillus transmontanensis TaxID=1034304 RepID=A0A5N6WAQ4_9EURO|nr:hypothetical protein BDV41DRAFT_523892 [Aspergillus transmontanensis]
MVQQNMGGLRNRQANTFRLRLQASRHRKKPVYILIVEYEYTPGAGSIVSDIFINCLLLLETWTEADPGYRPSATDRFTNMIGNHGTTQDNHPSMFEFKDRLKDMCAQTKTILSER